MVPMVHMILKWEKEIEQPNRPFIRHQIYAHLLKAKKENQSERKITQHTKTQKRCDFVNHVEPQICNGFV